MHNNDYTDIYPKLLLHYVYHKRKYKPIYIINVTPPYTPPMFDFNILQLNDLFIYINSAMCDQPIFFVL